MSSGLRSPSIRSAVSARALPAHEEALQGDPNPTLTRQAHSVLVARLVSFGNVLSRPHHDALLAVLSDFTRIAFGAQLGRFGYPLPTGMGKSQAVLAWLVALSQLGLTGEVQVAVVLSKVEALCQLKRDLIAAGVPDQDIGLQHSYPVSASPSTDERPKPGLASLPADVDARRRPILLATHMRLKRRSRAAADFGLGGARALVIWDESLLVSEPASFALTQLQQVANGLSQFLAVDGPAVRLLRGVETRVRQALELRMAGHPPSTMVLFDLPLNEAKAELDQALRSIWSAGLRRAARELIDFLNLAPNELAVTSTAQGLGLITYQVSVAPELNRIAVLDASYNARALTSMDPSITLRFQGMEDLKRFDAVRVRHISVAGGRESVEADCMDTSPAGGKVPRLVVEVVGATSSDEAVIVFTHKYRGPGAVDIAGTLRSAMARAGIDPDETIDVQGARRRRFVFLTWGDETSLSEFSYCKHVILAGLMYRSHLDLAAHMSGQVDDLLFDPDQSAVRAVELSELVHLVYQAMSRGASRIVSNGQAMPMTVTLMMKGDSLRAPLCSLMPGLQWTTYHSPVLNNEGAVGAVVDSLLDRLRAESAPKVSVRELRSKLSASVLSVSRRQFERALDIAAQAAGWARQSRSLAKVGL